MIGLDTNIVVRFFVEDDPGQFQRAGDLLRSLTPQDPGFISLVCLAEFAWVMRSQYRVSKTVIVVFLDRLLEAPELVLEHQVAVADAVRHFAAGACDFADHLIERVGRSAGCLQTVTFDVEASRSAGMELL